MNLPNKDYENNFGKRPPREFSTLHWPFGWPMIGGTKRPAANNGTFGRNTNVWGTKTSFSKKEEENLVYKNNGKHWFYSKMANWVPMTQ